MATVPRGLRAARLLRQLRPSRPMATASNHISLSGYIVPRGSSSSSSGSDDSLGRDLEVGELQGAKFKIEPLRRTGEDVQTMRARLLCECSTSSLLCLSRARDMLNNDVEICKDTLLTVRSNHRPISQAWHTRVGSPSQHIRSGQPVYHERDAAGTIRPIP
jgi:hypothetical protein